jgi:hypothetical protein
VSYSVGIVFGHFFFSSLFLCLTFILKKTMLAVSTLPYSVWLSQINLVCLTLILGLSLSSIPYYGLDYLLTGPLGFMSQDKLLDPSIFSQKSLKDWNRLLIGADMTFPLNIDTDYSYFDRGDYGEHVGFFHRKFEELNYQGEYSWLIRRDKKPNLYSSAQGTKTALQGFFQKTKPLTNQEIMMTDPKVIQPPTQKPLYEAIVRQSNDRSKMKRRFEENYNETRQKDRYLIGDSFNNFPVVMDRSTSVMEKTLKQKFNANRVYQALLNVEMDSFLNRQPKSYILTDEEEHGLFEKRQMLSQYYDTLRHYQHIEYHQDFQDFFQGSKTFVDRAYHHQFKGNLNIVRRLFPVTFENNGQSILTYDQPLFQGSIGQSHEELSPVSSHHSPFLEVNDATPFFLGFDKETRQMMLTKRFLPKPLLHYDMNMFDKLNEGIHSQPEKEMLFTTWPLSAETINTIQSNANAMMTNLVVLFETSTNPTMKSTAPLFRERSFVFTFPSNLRYIQTDWRDSLAPKRGGWFWPGTGRTSLKKDIFGDTSPNMSFFKTTRNYVDPSLKDSRLNNKSIREQNQPKPESLVFDHSIGDSV